MQKAALYTSGALFAFGAIGHGIRLATGFEITIAGYAIPAWVSLPGVIIAALLAVWMIAAARRH